MKALRTTLLIVAVGMAQARAQQPQKGTPLTLETALDLADKQNLDLAAARRRRAVALAGVQIAGQRPNPTFNFSNTRDIPHQGVFFSQPLEIGGKRKQRIELARQETALTEVGISTLERQIRRSTREAFYGLAFARAETARLAKVVQLADRLKQVAEQRFEAGDVAQLEVMQADLGAARARAEFQVAQQREKVSLSRLNALLNEPPSTEWEIASSLEDLPTSAPLEAVLQRAYQSNQELQRLAQEERVEQSRTNLLRAERIPNLDVEFGADFNALPEFRVGPRGQLSLTIPLFTRNQGEIAQSLVNQQVLESQIAATRRAVAGRVEADYLELASRRVEVELYRQKLLPVTFRLEAMAEESYRAGKANILTVLDTQRSAQDIEKAYLQSLRESQGAFAALEETVGAPLE